MIRVTFKTLLQESWTWALSAEKEGISAENQRGRDKDKQEKQHQITRVGSEKAGKDYQREEDAVLKKERHGEFAAKVLLDQKNRGQR